MSVAVIQSLNLTRLATIAIISLIVLLPFGLNSFWLFFLFQMVIFSYVAVSFNIAYSYGKLLSFAQGAFFAIGAYTAIYLAPVPGWGLGLAIVAALAICAAIGAVAGAIFVRMGGHNPTIATVILASASLLAANALAKYTGGEDGLALQAAQVSLASVAVPTGPNLSLYYLTAMPLVALLAGWELIRGTDFWKVVRAVATNEVRAQQLGFNIRIRRLVVIAFSGAVSALGGVFYTLLMKHVSSSAFDIGLSVNAILYAVVGGVGTIAGPVLGVFVIFPLTEVIAHYFLYVQILIGAILIGVAILFPKGILGTFSDYIERNQRK